MEKHAFFNSPYCTQCRFMHEIRHRLYEAETKEQRDRAIPTWMLEMAFGFERRFRLRLFTFRLFAPLLINGDDAHETDEEIVCVLNEIHRDTLHQTIREMLDQLGVTWDDFFKAP